MLIGEARLLLFEVVNFSIPRLKVSVSSRRKQIVHRHRPSWNWGFSFRNLPSPPGCKGFGIACPVDSNHVFAQEVDIPNNQSSGCEVIGALLQHLTFRLWSVIAFAANLHCKNRSALVELHPGIRPCVERGIRTERFAMRQVYDKSLVVANPQTKTFAAA